MTQKAINEMTEQEIYAKVREVLANVELQQVSAERHFQMLKYADRLEELAAPNPYPAHQFCTGVGLNDSFHAEFSKMRKMSQRLQKAGLDLSRI